MSLLTFACALSGIVLVLAARRARSDGLSALAAPNVIPLLYVTVATAWPTFWIYHYGELGSSRATALAPDTPQLMALGIIGFAVGTSIPLRKVAPRSVTVADPLTTVSLGRLLFLFPLAMRGLAVAGDAVFARGEQQATRDLTDSLAVAANMSLLVALVLITIGRRNQPKLFAPIDWVGILAVSALTGLSGDRASVLSLAMLVLVLWLSRASALSTAAKVRLVLVGAAFPAALALYSRWTLTYRTEAQTGRTVEEGFVESIVRDWGSVPFTTGHVAGAIRTMGTWDGETILAAFLRQIPSPVSVPLFGPVDDTGAYVFRELMHTSSSHGWGFSLIAEGVLNFGVLGALLLPLCVGLMLRWLYSKSDVVGARSINYIYFIAIATLPIAWRSDLLGTIKGTFYPFLALAAACLLARTMTREANRMSSSPLDGDGQAEPPAMRQRPGVRRL